MSTSDLRVVARGRGAVDGRVALWLAGGSNFSFSRIRSRYIIDVVVVHLERSPTNGLEASDRIEHRRHCCPGYGARDPSSHPRRTGTRRGTISANDRRHDFSSGGEYGGLHALDVCANDLTVGNAVRSTAAERLAPSMRKKGSGVFYIKDSRPLFSSTPFLVLFSSRPNWRTLSAVWQNRRRFAAIPSKRPVCPNSPLAQTFRGYCSVVHAAAKNTCWAAPNA
jgi:hypothetical protein